MNINCIWVCDFHTEIDNIWTVTGPGKKNAKQNTFLTEAGLKQVLSFTCCSSVKIGKQGSLYRVTLHKVFMRTYNLCPLSKHKSSHAITQTMYASKTRLNGQRRVWCLQHIWINFHFLFFFPNVVVLHATVQALVIQAGFMHVYVFTVPQHGTQPKCRVRGCIRGRLCQKTE